MMRTTFRIFVVLDLPASPENEPQHNLARITRQSYAGINVNPELRIIP